MFGQQAGTGATGTKAAITRMRELTRSGDYTYYINIAHFMADMPLGQGTDHPAGRSRRTTGAHALTATGGTTGAWRLSTWVPRRVGGPGRSGPTDGQPAAPGQH